MHACMHAVFNYETGVYEPDPNGDKLARLMYIHARDTWDKAVSGHTHTHTWMHADGMHQENVPWLAPSAHLMDLCACMLAFLLSG